MLISTIHGNVCVAPEKITETLAMANICKREHKPAKRKNSRSGITSLNVQKHGEKTKKF